MIKLRTVISFLLLIQTLFSTFKPILTSNEIGYENCGRIQPRVSHYIYGGRTSMIEQWPWQVINKTHFDLSN